MHSIPARLGNAMPERAGIGLKPDHFDMILEFLPDIGFFEIHAENYMVDGGPFHFYLERIRSHYPLSIHGVGLSIGAQAPVDEQHLNRLKILLDRYQPELFSEHLAWSTHQGHYLNDLLPVPYTQKTLRHVCEQIDHVQNRLGRRMLLENPATYLEFNQSSMSEAEFITAIVRETGCGLLLDINNVHVACTNHNQNSLNYIHALPLDTVGEIHLAGFATDHDSDGAPLLIDSHDAEVAPQVWSLYQATLALTGPRPTLLERDGNIPSLETLCAEANLAEQILLSQHHSKGEQRHA
ncbi:hypothetical protein LH51_09560 [Nitrincola sp. A-D6]|nr:hypothetical protein LH51_09560 [Nitrincola sp. A-D6]